MSHQGNMETPLIAVRFDLCYRHLNVIISKENLNKNMQKSNNFSAHIPKRHKFIATSDLQFVLFHLYLFWRLIFASFFFGVAFPKTANVSSRLSPRNVKVY